jgi:hypothetical protein
MALSTLPPELIQEIISVLTPKDVLNLSRSSSEFYDHGICGLTRLARDHKHDVGYILTSGLQDVSFWFEHDGSGSILEWAVVKDQFQTFVRLLADTGMDLLCTDGYGVTMLHRLSAQGMVTFMKPLIQRLRDLHMDVFPVDSCLLTPLHYAAGKGREEAVALLLEEGADVDAHDNHGNTALHLAAVTGSCGVLPLLVNAGANVSAETRFGWTPIDQASITHHHSATTVLQTLGSRPPSWQTRDDAISQFLSLSPCPLSCYRHHYSGT